MRERCVLIGRFVAVSLLAAMGLGAVQAGSEPGPLGSKPGWYSLDSGRRLLLVPSAKGGLYVADFDAATSSRMEESGTRGWGWSVGDSAEHQIRFQVAGAETLGFEWREEGRARQARKDRDPVYTVTEIFFANKDLRLAATLYSPPGGGPHPAAVFIHGSGASDRDNLWYQTIVHQLARSGVAVLLPDKRGTGKSQGDWTVASFEDFATDALAGVEILRRTDSIDPNRIGLVGISQGGWIAPLCATLTPGLAFVVNISGTTVTPNEQIVHELGGGLVGWARAAVAKARRPVWWRKNGDFDPIPYWQNLTSPALIVYGEDDEEDNVPVRQSVELIERSLLSGQDLTVRVFSNSGHGLMDAETGRIRGDFLELLSQWVGARTDGRPRTPSG